MFSGNGVGEGKVLFFFSLSEWKCQSVYMGNKEKRKERERAKNRLDRCHDHYAEA